MFQIPKKLLASAQFQERRYRLVLQSTKVQKKSEKKHMFRKALMIAMMTLAFFAASHSSVQASDPFPECSPCPFVR